jgi:hypothetical protein
MRGGVCIPVLLGLFSKCATKEADTIVDLPPTTGKKKTYAQPCIRSVAEACWHLVCFV